MLALEFLPSRAISISEMGYELCWYFQKGVQLKKFKSQRSTKDMNAIQQDVVI